MSHYLVYWRNYWQDSKDASLQGFQWNTKSESLFKDVNPGDVMWVVVNGGADNPGEWRLLRKIVIAESANNPPDHKYGPYRFVGDDNRSIQFMLEGQDDLAPVLQSLEFQSGKRIESTGTQIGYSLQSPRKLSEPDATRLSEYSTKLVLSRAN